MGRSLFSRRAAGAYTGVGSRRREKDQNGICPGVYPHDLRHTWASWHYCVYRDLLRLKSDGDWSNINTVTIYTKLMPPVYREEIVRWWGTGPAIALEGENP